jgi:PAS domain-containing protein
MRPATSPVSAIRRRTRNRAALLLFGRAIVTTLGVVSGALGFLTGIRMSANNYDPAAYATGVAALFAAACAVIAFLLMRRRLMIDKTRRLQAQVEELNDRNWELREAEERAHSLLQAQGDLIVRRDANGLITYANGAFCALAGRSRDE